MRALVLAFLLVLSPPLAQACALPSDLAALNAALLEAANTERANAGLPPLRMDAQLTEAAQTHACRNAERGQVSHRGSWFAGLGRRLRRVDYPYAMAVENLGAGQANPAEVMRDWARSPAHRVNLLAEQARDTGFGVARAADGWLHWVMIAAARR